MDPKLSIAHCANLLGISTQAVHKRLKARDIPVSYHARKAYIQHKGGRALLSLAYPHQVIAFQIVKGGTGKTTLAASIAVRAALFGARVLAIDLDQQANLTTALGINPLNLPCMFNIIQREKTLEDSIVPVADGLDLVPSNISNALLDNSLMLNRAALDRIYRDKIDALRSRYDLILMDCPPAIGASVTAATLASDTVYTPVTPETFSLSGLQITAQEIEALNTNYQAKAQVRVIVNKYDSRTTLSHEMMRELTIHPNFTNRIVQHYIRTSQTFANAFAASESIFDSLRPSAAQEDIDALTCTILSIYGEKPDSIQLGTLVAS